MHMITYNSITKDIEDFFKAHIQVSTYVASQTWDFQASDNIYPAVILVPRPSNIISTQLSLNFDLYICDILTNSRDNTKDVYSDNLGIAIDFLSYFSGSPDLDWTINDSVSLTPFEESFDDVLAGWVLNFTIDLPISKSICNIPVDFPN